ncbi:G1 family glutamic endopeptidase [Rudaeicoccus suwonensis]|uniref:Peptidase A4-like protein n=1 Tax=Rudaeicoccus suwonensis TaxID=657409 RepID=A0A561E7K9_9MICO|nr:G1 family glutamic endopeptidase [Rudaeicoccus suwonensis]TWE11594.1 peptidase A4-like protein [Rudaeicoccus suwonensis]
MRTLHTRRTLTVAAGVIALAAAGITGTGAAHAAQPAPAAAAHTFADGAKTAGLAAAHFGGISASRHEIGGAASLVNAHARHGFNINGGNWSGMVATGSGFTSTSTSWTEPSVTCNSTNDLMAPWVGIDSYGSSSVEQTGVATDCSSGSPVYQGWYEMYPANPVYYSNTVEAGDSITATVNRSGESYTLILTDNTQGWTQTTTQSYDGANASADFIIESPTASYPDFGEVDFTGSTVNGSALGDFSPTALDASNSNGYEDQTSALSGGTDFSISYLQE